MDELRLDGAEVGGSEVGSGDCGAGISEMLGVAEPHWMAARVSEPNPAGLVAICVQARDDRGAEVDCDLGAVFRVREQCGSPDRSRAHSRLL